MNKEVLYNNNGKIIMEGWFQNGKQHRDDGPAVINYNNKGKVKRELWYVNGKHIKNSVIDKWLKETGVDLFTEKGKFEFILTFG